MRDKRPVDELSIEELERILAIKKREARKQQLGRMKRTGRIVSEPKPHPVQPAPPPPEPEPDNAPFALPFEPGGDTIGQVVNGDVAHAPAPQPQKSSAASLKAPQKSAVPRFEDDPGDMPVVGSRKRDDVWKRFVNRSLLLVEVAAVFGLLVIGFSMVNAVNTLQAETESAQQMANQERIASVPTLEPTPTLRIADVVLPSGHVVVNDTPRFNEDEVPAHLRLRIEEEIYRPVIRRPEPTSETALVLHIPRLGISETIIQGTDWEALRQGVGQVLNGGSPTDVGTNVVLAAHNDIYGEIFRHLEDLVPGDEFQIQTATQTFTYVIHEWEIVQPDAVHVMDHQPGRALATLISCWPYQVSDRRIVVHAERVDTLTASNS